MKLAIITRNKFLHYDMTLTTSDQSLSYPKSRDAIASKKYFQYNLCATILRLPPFSTGNLHNLDVP